MKRRIFLALLLMGVFPKLVAALIITATVICSSSSHTLTEIERECRVMAEAYDAGIAPADLHSLLSLTDDYRLSIVEPDGTVSFDNITGYETPPPLAGRPELTVAAIMGSASGKYKPDNFKNTVYYCAVRLDNGAVMRLSMTGTMLMSYLVAAITVLFVILPVLILISTTVSKKLTNKITEPVRDLASELEGDISAPSEPIYPEFRPQVEKIRRQQNEIKHQLELAEKEKRRISAIINSMDEGIVILGNDMRVIILNEKVCRTIKTPFPKDECIGLLMSEICRDQKILDCFERTDTMSFRSDGRIYQLNVTDICNQSEMIGRIGWMLDVTERTEIDRIKQEFTANVSHEMKTPLTSISGYAELIESGMAKGEDVIVFAGRIRRESERMMGLITDIIKLSRLETEGPSASLEQVDLGAICRESVEALEDSALRNGVSLSFNGRSFELTGSRSELSELVGNLIVNAIRYNKRGGRVDVSIELRPKSKPDGAIAMLTVSDSGIGIPEDQIPRVFERFYRIDRSRSKDTGGTGLGLAIVKHVAERHGATVELQSKLGVGTTVRVTFYEKAGDKKIG